VADLAVDMLQIDFIYSASVGGGGLLSTGSPAVQVAMVCIGPGSMYSQAYVSTGGSCASVAPCDRVD